ncbi:unnamed protein product [Sympodiomycopsis kandeliae]
MPSKTSSSKRNGHTNTRAQRYANLTNGHASPSDSKASPSAFSSWSHLKSIHDAVEDHIRDQARKTGFRGELARQLLSKGEWARDVLEAEWDNRRHAIGGIDNMWLHLSHYDFNPVCAAGYTLKDVPSTEKITETLGRMVDKFPKYGSKLANTGRKLHGSTFVPDTQFDIRNHFTRQSLPSPAGPEQLDNFIAQVESRPWDFSKPLWECIVLDNFQDTKTGAKAALVMRGHHTLTDGQGFVMSQLSITSFGPELEDMLSDASHLLHDAKRGKAQPSKLSKKLKPLDAWHHLLPVQLLLFVAFWIFYVTSSFVEFFYSTYQAFYTGMMYLLTFWRIPKVTAPYSGPRVLEKEFATTESFDISDVKKIQKAFSGVRPGSWAEPLQGGRKSHVLFGHLTLNDVLCTVIADVIGYELHHPSFKSPNTITSRLVKWSHNVLPRPVVLMIPISIRPLGDWSMKNWSTGSLAYLPNDGKLPNDPKKIWKRLHSSSSALSVLKDGFLPTISFWLINLPTSQVPLLFPSPLWTLIQGLVAWFVGSVLTSFTAVLTNVPGPSSKKNKDGGSNDLIKLCDQPILSWSASPPQAGKGTLGIGVITYENSVSVTICADKVQGSEGVAKRLKKRFEDRWREYVRIADSILEAEQRKDK